jgi:ferredoxin--NADP+ reductase
MRLFAIVEKRHMANNTVCHFKIEAPLIAKKAKPGQFVVLRPHETGERIPLTIIGADPVKGIIDIIFQKVGKSTALLGTFNKGDAILDIIGPLGKPTLVEKLGTIICVGGGTGIAALYPIARAFKEIGNHVISIIGARTKDLLIMEEEMKKVSDELLITTDDGSYGRPGLVTDALKDLLDEKKDVKLIVAIGPIPMMKFVCKTTEPYGVKTVVSLNTIMVDATGMCGACRVTVGGKKRFCCVDGPEFDGHQVDFDELMKRQASYLKEERQSYELFMKEQRR